MIQLLNVSKRFDGANGPVDALRDVSLHVERGDICGIIGFSGAGKSTLLRMVNMLESPDSGSVKVAGRELTALSNRQLRDVRRTIGMVFQQFNLLETQSVHRNIALPLLLDHTPRERIEQRVAEVLRIVELEDKRDAYVSELSGGQKQRVGIARALATNPDILLCDEATSALDPKTTESILALLKRINHEMGVTILLITHQMRVIQQICTKVGVMEDGRIVESGRVLDVFGSPQQAITQEFVRTVINDSIPPSMRALLDGDERNFVVDRLRFVGESVRRPVLATVGRVEGLELNILGATVEELEDTPMCLYLVQLIGDQQAISAAESVIDAEGVTRERVALS